MRHPDRILRGQGLCQTQLPTQGDELLRCGLVAEKGLGGQGHRVGAVLGRAGLAADLNMEGVGRGQERSRGQEDLAQRLRPNMQAEDGHDRRVVQVLEDHHCRAGQLAKAAHLLLHGRVYIARTRRG